jgi:GntR family transcriptional regulator
MRFFTTPEIAATREESPLPLYHKIFQVIRHKIESGTLKHGQMLPSELDVASSLGVSRVTVKRAFDELALMQLVDRRRGRGTRVTHRYEPKIMRAPLASLIDGLILMGRETTVDVLSFQSVPAPSAIAQALKIAPGTAVDRAVRVRSQQQEAFAYYVSHTIALGKSYSAQALRKQARLTLFHQLGVRVAEVDQIISAGSASSEVALALQVPVGSSVLELVRIYFDAGKRPIDHLQCFYRADRFQYHMRLSTSERHK